MEQFWTGLCKDLNVPDAIGAKWLQRFLSRYSLPHRCYHNEEAMFLTHKLPHLNEAKDPAVALACIFQYLEYRPKTDLSDENCALFREFATEAGLGDNQVSGPVLVHIVVHMYFVSESSAEGDNQYNLL